MLNQLQVLNECDMFDRVTIFDLCEPSKCVIKAEPYQEAMIVDNSQIMRSITFFHENIGKVKEVSVTKSRK